MHIFYTIVAVSRFFGFVVCEHIMKTFLPFQIKLPASSANIGPGFDCFGLALQLYNVFTFSPNQHFVIDCQGICSDALLDAERNLLIHTYRTLCQHYDQVIQPFHLHSENHIPFEAGLGSSATAITAGAYAFRRIYGKSLDRASIAGDAVHMENHVDNIGACLYGGFIVGSVHVQERLQAWVRKVPLAVDFRCLIVQPDAAQTNTETSRSALPKQLARSACISNIANAANLILALTQGNAPALFAAMDDQIHQPYRVTGDFYVLRQILKQAGALGVALSGSGPSMIVFYQQQLPAIKSVIDGHFTEQKQSYRLWELAIDHQGMQAKDLEPV